MSLDGRIGARVAALMGRVGTPVTVRRLVRSTGPNPSETATDHVVPARVGGFDAHLIDGTNVTVRDLRVVVAARALPITPDTGDRLVIEGVERAIVAVRPGYVVRSPALWDIQAR